MTQYLTPKIIREIASKASVSPSKAFGQNFMVDTSQVQKIVRLSGAQPGESVLEVGPGLGSLTLGLLDASAHVLAVEIDTKLATLLPETVQQFASENAGSLEVLQMDAMGLSADLPAMQNVSRIISNLPYNVATPIILTLLGRFPGVKTALVLVQAEVASRLCAEPGSKIYGIPSAKLAWFGSARIAGDVPRSAFWPVPRVDSKLVAFTRYETPPKYQSAASRDDTFSLVNLAFSARRKTLRSLLTGHGYSSAAVQQAFESLQIDPLARGETLSIDQFAYLAGLLGE
jgi:16S rRNA (adenine1518-N6/adenine1519-N6)-dimethyltransferase